MNTWIWCGVVAMVAVAVLVSYSGDDSPRARVLAAGVPLEARPAPITVRHASGVDAAALRERLRTQLPGSG